MMPEYRCWVVMRGDKKWRLIGEHANAEDAYRHALKKYGSRLGSVRVIAKRETA